MTDTLFDSSGDELKGEKKEKKRICRVDLKRNSPKTFTRIHIKYTGLQHAEYKLYNCKGDVLI